MDEYTFRQAEAAFFAAGAFVSIELGTWFLKVKRGVANLPQYYSSWQYWVGCFSMALVAAGIGIAYSRNNIKAGPWEFAQIGALTTVIISKMLEQDPKSK